MRHNTYINVNFTRQFTLNVQYLLGDHFWM